MITLASVAAAVAQLVEHPKGPNLVQLYRRGLRSRHGTGVREKLAAPNKYARFRNVEDKKLVSAPIVRSSFLRITKDL